MSCDAIVYPYIDPVTGIRKWRGVGGSGDETCSSIFTGSNIVRLPVEVSLADDDGLQDGETSFCRRYGDQTPATVVLTAPDNYGDVSRPFRHWVLDGVKQEDGELSLSVLVTGEECHIVKAVYGNIVNTCREGMEWLDVATLSANLSWNVSDNPFCTRFSCPICPPDGHDVVPLMFAAAPNPVNVYLVESDANGATYEAQVPFNCTSCFDPLNEPLFRCLGNAHCPPDFIRAESCSDGVTFCSWGWRAWAQISVGATVRIACSCIGQTAQLAVWVSYGVGTCAMKMAGFCGTCQDFPICPDEYPFCCPCQPCCWKRAGDLDGHTGAIGFPSNPDGELILKEMTINGTTEDCLAKLAIMRDGLWTTGDHCFDSNANDDIRNKHVDGCWSIRVQF